MEWFRKLFEIEESPIIETKGPRDYIKEFSGVKRCFVEPEISKILTRMDSILYNFEDRIQSLEDKVKDLS